MKPLRCPLCSDNIRQEIVMVFNGLHPTKERQRELLAGFDARIDAVTFDDHAGLVDHLVAVHGWVKKAIAEPETGAYNGR